MVKQLEDRLGVLLLERHKREVRLTKAGEAIFASCERIFDSVDEIVALTEREKSECHGPLAFGASDSVAAYLIPSLLKKYLKDHPRVYPSIFAGTSNLICKEILENRIEFGLFFTVPEEEGYSVRDLIQIPFLLVVAKMKQRELNLERSFIGSREIDYPKIRSFPVLEMLRRNGIQARIVISSNSLESHRRMVLEGLGISLLPRFMVEEDIRQGRLTVIYPKKQFFYPLRLVTRKGKVLSKNAETFLDGITQ
jgi:DNA-binding transcriptional LysR family regulator